MKRVLPIILSFFCLNLAFGQAQQDYSARSEFDPNESTVTKSKDKDKFDHTKTANYPKSLEYFIIKNPTRVLYGNSCSEEAARNKGFKYVLSPKVEAEGYTKENRVWHNVRTHFKLTFKNGLFYRKKVKKQIKRCKKSSGDFVG